MKIAFHIDNLSFRGTTTAVWDYAFYNQTILGNESVIIFDSKIKNSLQDENFVRKGDVLKRYNIFQNLEYEGLNDLENKLNKNKCDYIYFLKAGFDDGYNISGTKSLIHSVFNYCQPHGHKYAYVSKWLSNEASGGMFDYVPHVVSMPELEKNNYREKLGIPEGKIVIGRYGGFDQFDIDFVKSMVNFISDFDDNFYFVFVNTRDFVNRSHPRIKFLESIVDPQEKTDFIKSCDAMIHARSDGESFGLSICEFLFHGKPTISFGGGRDKHNVEMLSNYDLIYNNHYELLEKFFKLKHNMFKSCYSCLVKEFSPINVMNKFNSVFLG